MEYRNLGDTGLQVSALGFGCGAVGGLMVRGDEKTRVRAVERAIEAGINYFDTAQIYGDGQSEIHLGQVLQTLKPDIVVGTKIRVADAGLEHIEATIVEGVEISLKSLQLERLDLLQLHNSICLQRHPERNWLGVDDLGPAQVAFQKLQEQGKICYWGINGLGETEVLHRAVSEYGGSTVQICCNLFNPSAALEVEPDFPFQNYRRLIDRAAENGRGVIAFRVMAAGALSGRIDRHPVAAQSVETIASNPDFAADVAQSERFAFLITEGWVDDLPEAAIRFVMNQRKVSTTLIGLSSLDQLEQAIAAAEKGPLPQEALDRLPAVWAEFQPDGRESA